MTRFERRVRPVDRPRLLRRVRFLERFRRVSETELRLLRLAALGEDVQPDASLLDAVASFELRPRPLRQAIARGELLPELAD